MAFFCQDCGERRPGGGLKKPCPFKRKTTGRRCGGRFVDRVPPLDGYAWFGEHPTDEEAKAIQDEHFNKKRRLK